MLCILICSVLFLTEAGAANAPEFYSVTVGQDATFTECNYYDKYVLHDSYYKNYNIPLGDAVADNNTASIHFEAVGGHASMSQAEAGVQFFIDLGDYPEEDALDRPLKITFDISYLVDSSYQSGCGFVISEITLPEFLAEGLCFFDEDESVSVAQDVTISFTRWLDGAPILVKDFVDQEMPLPVTVLVWNRIGTKLDCDMHTVDVKARVNSVKVSFPDFPSSTTTTAPFPENSTTTTTVIDEELIPRFYGTPREGDAPLEVHFADLSEGSPSGWYWGFGDGSTGTKQNPVHTYDMPGVYTVALTVSNAAGEVYTNEKPDYIIVNAPSLEADFAAGTRYGRAPLEVQFADRSKGTIVSRDWEFGDGQTGQGPEPLHTYQEPGIYTVTLVVTDDQGRQDAREIIDFITVEDEALAADFTASPRSGSAPLEVQFADNSTGSVESMIWYLGDGTYTDEASPRHSYTEPGIYSVGLRVQDARGRIAEALKEDYIAVDEPSAGQTVSGTVSGEQAAGADVFLSGNAERRTQADETGAYRFEGLARGQYRITPFREGVSFEPKSKAVQVAGSDITGIDFTAAQASPDIVRAAVEPSTVPADGDTEVLLTAQVSHPGGLANVSEVLCDLRQLGGQLGRQLCDNGTAGDEHAGDGVYSLKTTVAGDVAPGAKGIRLLVRDSTGGAGFASVSLDVIQQKTHEIRANESQKKSVENELAGQTLRISVSRSSQSESAFRLQPLAAGDLLLQIFDPDGEPYFDSPVSIGSNSFEVQIDNAGKGTWSYQVDNQYGQQMNYNVSVSTTGVGIIAGNVVDANSGAGIDGAWVRTDAGNEATTEDGYYILMHPAGFYTVQASSLQGTYSTAARSVSLSAGQTVEAHMMLSAVSDNGSDCLLSSLLHGRADAHRHLSRLRAFRDSCLMHTAAGRRYVGLYYRYSPVIIRMMKQDGHLRSLLLQAADDALSCLEGIEQGRLRFSGLLELHSISRCVDYLRMSAPPALAEAIAHECKNSR